jgi:hypothetical protein
VYVENIKEPAVERTVEIMQKDRGFVPNFLAIQKGTRVSFPNADPFLHNVFSPSPTSPFDLGSYHPGEKPGVVRFFNSGVVEVLCARQVIAWTPDAKPHAESVALTPTGATLNFSLQVEPAPPSLDKSGMPRR